MSEHAPKRRRLRFSLRAMFVAIAILGLWLGWNLKSVRDRNAMLGVIASRNGFIDSTRPDTRDILLISTRWSSLQSGGKMPASWRILGVRPVHFIDFYEHLFTAEEISRIQALFPEADIALWRTNI